MKKSTGAFTPFFILALLIFPGARLAAQKDTVTIGAYITSLYDFSLPDNSFKCDFWYWALYKNPELDFRNSIEITHSKSFEFRNPFTDTLPGLFWFQANTKSEVKKDWDISKFPFDVQKIDVILESADGDTSSLVFVGDTKNSKVAPDLVLNDWHIRESKFESVNSHYVTTFGNPNLDGESVYPAFKMSFTIERKDSFLILFKLITGVIVAFIIACSVFFIKPYHTDPRFQLCVGGLFAAVGNKYIVEGIVPSSNVVTLLDNIHNTTFVYILFIIVLSIISLFVYERKTEGAVKLAERIDKFAFVTILVSYSVIITTLVLHAVS